MGLRIGRNDRRQFLLDRSNLLAQIDLQAVKLLPCGERFVPDIKVFFVDARLGQHAERMHFGALLLEEILDMRRGDREIQVLPEATLKGVDSQDLALGIHQRSAAVAGRDRRGSLDPLRLLVVMQYIVEDVLVPALAHDLAKFIASARRGHNSLRNRPAHAQRSAEGKHPLTFRRQSVGERQRRSVLPCCGSIRSIAMSHLGLTT